MNADLFGSPLTRDPAIALPSLNVPPGLDGPSHVLQFVIEIVGPRTMPAPAVQGILQPQWQHVLGSPHSYVMAGTDQQWRPLSANDGSGAYDSLLLAWDLISPRGPLSTAITQNMWTAAEDLAKQLSRRAIAMPIPQDVPQNVRAVQEFKESFDVGFNLTVVARASGFPERDIWKLAAALGLEYGQNGAFEYRAPNAPRPLFQVLPGGESDRFVLSQVQLGVEHPCVGIGFSLPLCPMPLEAMRACFSTAIAFAERLGGVILDEDDEPMTDRRRANQEQNFTQALGAITKAGVVPGADVTARLFEG